MGIEDKKPITFYLNAIDAYNSTQKKNREISKGYIETNDYKGFDKAKLGLIVVALERYNIDSLTNILGLSKSTVNKYKADLLKIGYTKNSLNKVNIDVPDIDFKTYYIETTFNQYKFFQNNMFKLD